MVYSWSGAPVPPYPRIRGHHDGVPARKLQDLSLGQRAAIKGARKKVDCRVPPAQADNRPDWFLAIPPHRKVRKLWTTTACRVFDRTPSLSISTKPSRRVPSRRSGAINRA
jgi:hypothetical protein